MSNEGRNTNGKGSKPRPFSVDRTTFEENWDRIFSEKMALSEPFSEDDTDTHQTPKKRKKNAYKQW